MAMALCIGRKFHSIDWACVLVSLSLLSYLLDDDLVKYQTAHNNMSIIRSIE